jgi:hypothetical protein
MCVNYRKELKQLREKQAADCEKLKIELRLKKLFDCKRAMSSDLWGCVGGVTFEVDSFKEVAKIISKHKPYKMFYNRDGCASFQPYAVNSGKSEEVFGIKTKIEYQHYNTIESGHKIEFYYYVETKYGLVYVDINIKNKTSFAVVMGDYKRFQGGYRIDNCQLVKHEVLNSFKSVQWGRGSDEYYNSFTLHNDVNYKLDDFISLLKNFKG